MLLLLAELVSISVLESTPCCIDADVGFKTVIYHSACFTTQVVTFTHADGQRPTVYPYSLSAKDILVHSLRTCP